MYDALVTGEHDGDTCAFTLRLRPCPKTWSAEDLGTGVEIDGQGWIVRKISGRFLGENADEIATPTGKQALAYLASIMPIGTWVTLQSYVPAHQLVPDKFGGRWDVVIVLSDGTNVNQKMLDTGHAAPWNGQGAKPTT